MLTRSDERSLQAISEAVAVPPGEALRAPWNSSVAIWVEQAAAGRW